MKRSLSALVLIALMPSWVVAQERIKFPVGVSWIFFFFFGSVERILWVRKCSVMAISGRRGG